METVSQTLEVETLRFGYGDTKLGPVLVALSDCGVAAILLGDNQHQLRQELSGSFPGAQLVEDNAGLAEAIAKIFTLINAPSGTLALRGSQLERAVWMAISPGETRTYGALAKALPVPAAAQEVGAVCAANRVAAAVPCHRVVKADGSISGYHRGVHRKRRLITTWSTPWREHKLNHVFLWS